MELDWSEQSPHIRTLYRSWQPDDGYEEATITTAETQLGVPVPTLLRAFYRTWGKRHDLTQTRDCLLAPHELVVQADALIFCMENQATFYWAVKREFLEEFNPPVVAPAAEAGRSVREVQSTLTWRPSHAHLSDLLDDLTYENAFSGGAIHGAFRKTSIPKETGSCGWSGIGATRVSPRCASGWSQALSRVVYLSMYVMVRR